MRETEINEIIEKFSLPVPKGRKREIVHKKVIIAYLFRKYSLLSTTKIGEIIGVDHATIIHYLKKYDQEIIYKDFQIYAESIETIFKEIMKQNRAEDKMQIEFYTWFHNTYPEHRGLLNYNLNNPANQIQGKVAKRMGLQKARPDMELNYQGKTYYNELKVPPNKPSKEQLEMHSRLREEGFEVVVTYSVDECKEWIETVLKS